MNEKISSHMTKNVVSLGPNEPLSAARQILLSGKIHHLPITDDGKLLGLITSWDMFKLGKSPAEYGDMKCRDIMSTHLATLDPEQHLGAAAMVLMEHLFHAIPIVNDAGELKGMITSYDLLKYEYSKEYPDDLSKFIPENMG